MLPLARTIAAKSLAAIRARKIASVPLSQTNWKEAYLDAQLSAELTALDDGGERVSTFLERPAPEFRAR